jgi:hypothetical protein
MADQPHDANGVLLHQHQHHQQPQQQEASPVALKPVTNGQTRKRPAAADDSCDATAGASPGGGQAAKVPRLGCAPDGVQASDAGQQLVEPAEQEEDLTAHPEQPQQLVPAAPPAAADAACAADLLQRVVGATHGAVLGELELLHARLSRVVSAHAAEQQRSRVLARLAAVVADVEQQLRSRQTI